MPKHCHFLLCTASKVEEPPQVSLSVSLVIFLMIRMISCPDARLKSLDPRAKTHHVICLVKQEVIKHPLRGEMNYSKFIPHC